MTQKSGQKGKYLLERKELLRPTEKHYSSFSKGFQLPKIVSDLSMRPQYSNKFQYQYIQSLQVYIPIQNENTRNFKIKKMD